MRTPPPKRRSFLALALGTLFAVAILAPAPASAQDALRIAAVVNEDAISVLDVRERTELIFATAGLTDNAETRRRILPQVLRILIDESLQLQEVARLGYDLEGMDLAAAYRVVEQNLGLPTGQLLTFLSQNKLSQASFDRQLKAEISWSELINQRLREDSLSDEDIDAELVRIESTANETAYLLAEIYLTVDDPDREPEIAGNMQRLREAIQSGASFPALAQQFSQSVSAAEGGSLGWVVRSQLSDEVRAALDVMTPGSLSEPLRVIGGFSLILLRDRREGLQIDPLDASIVMRQAIVPVGAGETEADLRAQAELVAAALQGCESFDDIQARFPGTMVSNAVTVRLGDIQPRFLEAIEDLPVGTLSAPIATDQGLHLVMVCTRAEPDSPLPSRDEVRADLDNLRYDLLSRGYMRDLRRSSFVDVRL